MAKADMRARVERLIHGEFRPEDISTLFLYLRARSRGRETVAEIGDFFAHRDKKIKGITTVRVRDWFTYMRFANLITEQQVPIDKLPKNFPEVLCASFRQIRDQVLMRDTGLKRKRVEKLLPEIIKKLRPNSSGGLTAEALTDTNEQAIANCLIGYNRGPRLAFSEERLFKEFQDALLVDRLLEEHETTQFSNLRRAVSLSAITAMHLTEIDLGDGTKAQLSAAANCGSGTLGMNAIATVHYPPVGDVGLGGGFYITSMPADECCEPTLLEEPSFPYWECPIEITPEQMLTVLS